MKLDSLTGMLRPLTNYRCRIKDLGGRLRGDQ